MASHALTLFHMGGGGKIAHPRGFCWIAGEPECLRLRFFAVIPKIYLSTWRKKFGTGDPVHHPVTGESSDRPGMTKIAHFSKFQYFSPKFEYMNIEW